jgi:hypothetical protein
MRNWRCESGVTIDAPSNSSSIWCNSSCQVELNGIERVYRLAQQNLLVYLLLRTCSKPTVAQWAPLSQM